MTAEAASYQQFIGACRAFWAGPMFRALQRQVAAEAHARGIDAATDPAAFEHLVRQHSTHAVFAWFERHLQRMKYSGRWDLAPMYGAQRDALLAQLAAAEATGRLALDPALTPPAYWLDHDIHQHPGGLGDDIAGFVYRAAVDQGGVVGRPQLHERFAQAALAERSPASILDMGCGYGRSAFAFAAAAPAASVTGIDLSESCLRLAAIETPAALHNRVRFRRADAAAPGGERFDMVTSTMLLHELPDAALRTMIGETARLLEAGGVAVHLDFLPPADLLLRILYDGHSDRNNEPFMRDLGRIDLVEAHRQAGFDRVEITPFAEADGALDEPARRWRLPWTMIVATKSSSPKSLSQGAIP